MSLRLSTASSSIERLSNIHYSAPMPLAEDSVTSRYRITAYGNNSVTVNEVVYRQSLILTAEEMITPWDVGGLEDLTPQNLAPVLELNPAVVLLGTGSQQQFPGAEIMAHFGQRGIGLEVMDNGALCRTFNILVAEDRAVAAAILLNP